MENINKVNARRYDKDHCLTCHHRITDNDDNGMEDKNGQRYCLNHAPMTTIAEELSQYLKNVAERLIDPIICRSPAYGAPGYAHCAACCYGTGVIITCEEEQAIYEAVLALKKGCRLNRLIVKKGPSYTGAPFYFST